MAFISFCEFCRNYTKESLRFHCEFTLIRHYGFALKQVNLLCANAHHDLHCKSCKSES
ncbi:MULTISPECIES: hypothetical protein [Helicobacter]|uniref:hypothetical protein n=1 Tax=Helicobacter TaxID=209 RepID=UPI00260C6439|nr:hypothetical protein [Helicobacter sp. UBA3407]